MWYDFFWCMCLYSSSIFFRHADVDISTLQPVTMLGGVFCIVVMFVLDAIDDYMVEVWSCIRYTSLFPLNSFRSTEFLTFATYRRYACFRIFILRKLRSVFLTFLKSFTWEKEHWISKSFVECCWVRRNSVSEFRRTLDPQIYCFI